MARKRLNDTDAIRATPVDGMGEKHITIRPVANGYMLRESKYDGNGGYSSAERFCKSEPCVYEGEPSEKTSAGGLRDATKYLKGR